MATIIVTSLFSVIVVFGCSAELCGSPENHSSYCDLLVEEFGFDESLPAG